MHEARYPFEAEASFALFAFVSEGPQGRIRKLVQYLPFGVENVFNLAFGDYEAATHGLNDLAVTNNGDGQKVLATVAATVYAFISRHPNAWIFATGSTPARTRLYRMGITRHLAAIAADFVVLGYTPGEEWEEFVVGEDYSAYLLTSKHNYYQHEN